MNVAKRTKNSRQRGTKFHGWGRGKAHHKGAGSRGGRGNAGTGKRGDQNKPRIWKGGKYFGKHGFKVGKKEIITGINIRDLDARLEGWIIKGKAAKEGDMYKVDLSKLGYGKLLSGGETTKKINVEGVMCSGKAAEKIQKAGGVIGGEPAQEA